MRDLPSGTLTLLFSDVEGSTHSMTRLGEHWGAALSAQRELLRAAFERHEGIEMGTEGDSFFVVFTSARRAVIAAIEAQQGLQQHAWPLDLPLRVRMGLHTGEPERHEDGYIGLDVHRAARIAAAAAGDQIVISEAVRLLAEPLGADVTVRDLGHHRLKDLPEPEHLHDLAVAGLRSSFPPLRSLGSAANLPSAVTPLVGRDGELGELRDKLREPGVRLLTLTGPGGAGKTRLAVEVASTLENRFPTGVFFVDLHTALDEQDAWLGIANSLDALGDAEELPRDRVRRTLATATALLILDNLEQLVGADRLVAELLSSSPLVSVLATSRRPLHLASEFEHPVPPLELPSTSDSDPEQAIRAGAVDLFVRRARMVRPSFDLGAGNVDDVVELCRRLDGLPLAIELAAARSKMLSPHALLGRLDQTLGSDLAPADRTERQRTLAATIAWSYHLLSEPDQAVLRQLGVFAGQFDVSSVEEVVEVPDVDLFESVVRLVDMSLAQIVDGPDGEPRISLLQTIRDFARHELQLSGQGDQTRLRHAQWCAEQASEVDQLLAGPTQVEALDRMSLIGEDVRAALEWCLQPPDGTAPERASTGLRLVANLHMYWYRFGYAAEGRAWFERALAATQSLVSVDMINALHGLAILRLQQADVEPAMEGIRRALEMARGLGERDLESRELNSLALAHRTLAEMPEARRLLGESLSIAREIGNVRRESAALSNLVVFLIDEGDWAGALSAGREAIAASRRLGDAWAVSSDEVNLAAAVLRVDGAEAAYRHLASIAPDALASGDPELVTAVAEIFAVILAELGQPSLSARLVAAADVRRAVLGMPRSEPDVAFMDASFETSGARADPGWATGYAEGKDVSLDEVLAEALSSASAR